MVDENNHILLKESQLNLLIKATDYLSGYDPDNELYHYYICQDT